MARAQGSLEYLIIIAIVLAVSGIVVGYMVGIVGGQRSTVTLTGCKQAAVDCKAAKLLSPSDPCLSCETSCRDSASGQEVSTSAVECCQNAQVENIYVGSPGCHVVMCGDGAIEGTEQCEAGDPGACLSGCDTSTCTCLPAVCGDGYVDPSGGEQCDDADTDVNDSCVNCKNAYCGDTYIWNKDGGTETCEKQSDCGTGECASCQCQTAFTVSIISPASSAWLNSQAVSLTATTNYAADCTYRITTSLPMTTTNGLSHSASLSLTDGSYTVTVTCTRRSDNKVASSSVSFGVDTVPPTVSMTSTCGTVSLIKAITATASDSRSGLGQIEFLTNGRSFFNPSPISNPYFCTPVGSTSNPLGSSFSYTWNTRYYPNGTRTLSVNATDKAGNEVASTACSVNVQNVVSCTTDRCGESIICCTGSTCCACSDGYTFCKSGTCPLPG